MKEPERRDSPARGERRTVRVGQVIVGGGQPVSVQSMTKTDTRDVARTLSQIESLAAAGCEIVRVAVPDRAAASALTAIKKASPLPVVADIHFDHKLALAALEAGVDKLRLNPGNLGSAEKIRLVARLAAELGVPIRVGANAGSIRREDRDRFQGDTARALVESALAQARLLEDAGHQDIVLSVKSYDLKVMIRAYREIACLTKYPLHVGVTEAGTGMPGTVRSAAGLGALLLEGIGDTIRVSLTGPPEDEVRVGREILLCTGCRAGLTLVSCPTCGRTSVDMTTIVEEVRNALSGIDSPLRVAVMGCEVNGPGEAREADVGVAVTGGRGLLFRRGKPVGRLEREEIVPVLLKEVRRMAREDQGRGLKVRRA